MSGAVDAMRAAFDAGFARPADAARPDTIDLLAIGVADRAYALRIDQIREIATCRSPVGVPADATGLLGLVGVRDAIVPVFSLAVLLGHAAPGATPAWMVVCAAGDEPVALAFDVLDGHRRVAREAVAAGAVTLDGAARALVDLVAVTSSLQRQEA